MRGKTSLSSSVFTHIISDVGPQISLSFLSFYIFSALALRKAPFTYTKRILFRLSFFSLYQLVKHESCIEKVVEEQDQSSFNIHFVKIETKKSRWLFSEYVRKHFNQKGSFKFWGKLRLYFWKMFPSCMVFYTKYLSKQ